MIAFVPYRDFGSPEQVLKKPVNKTLQRGHKFDCWCAVARGVCARSCVCARVRRTALLCVCAARGAHTQFCFSQAFPRTKLSSLCGAGCANAVPFLSQLFLQDEAVVRLGLCPNGSELDGMAVGRTLLSFSQSRIQH